MATQIIPDRESCDDIRVRRVDEESFDDIFDCCAEYKFRGGRKQDEYFGNRYTCDPDPGGNPIASQELLQFSGSRSELSLKCRGGSSPSNIHTRQTRNSAQRVAHVTMIFFTKKQSCPNGIEAWIEQIRDCTR